MPNEWTLTKEEEQATLTGLLESLARFNEDYELWEYDVKIEIVSKSDFFHLSVYTKVKEQ